MSQNWLSKGQLSPVKRYWTKKPLASTFISINQDRYFCSFLLKSHLCSEDKHNNWPKNLTVSKKNTNDHAWSAALATLQASPPKPTLLHWHREKSWSASGAQRPSATALSNPADLLTYINNNFNPNISSPQRLIPTKPPARQQRSAVLVPRKFGLIGM
jgi:hypothetical protein